MRKQPRILFFVKGSLPSKEAYDIADEFGVNVAFRNASVIRDGACIEACDGVAGEVPESYSHIRPAKEVIAEYRKPSKAKAEETTKQEETAKPEEVEKPKPKAKAKAEKPKTEGKGKGWTPNA